MAVTIRLPESGPGSGSSGVSAGAAWWARRAVRRPRPPCRRPVPPRPVRRQLLDPYVGCESFGLVIALDGHVLLHVCDQVRRQLGCQGSAAYTMNRAWTSPPCASRYGSIPGNGLFIAFTPASAPRPGSGSRSPPPRRPPTRPRRAPGRAASRPGATTFLAAGRSAAYCLAQSLERSDQHVALLAASGRGPRAGGRRSRTARPGWLPPSLITRSARTRGASTYVTSLSVVRACSGVLVRDGRTVHVCRPAVSNELGRADDPPPERVQAAAVQLLARGPAGTGSGPNVSLLPDARRLVRLDRRPADARRPAARSPPAPGRGSSTTAAGTAARGRAGGSPGRARAARASPSTTAGTWRW